MEDKEFGLVLAGGGTKGAFQVGAWKALCEIGVNVKAIVGASIGALNGALFLQDDYMQTVKMYENIKIDNIMKVEGVDANKNIFDLSLFLCSLQNLNRLMILNIKFLFANYYFCRKIKLIE